MTPPVPSLSSRFVQPFLHSTLFAFDLGLYLFDMCTSSFLARDCSLR